ncbi:hypothetical protein [Kribbella voronezhensis]|uniref:hypothetical protein n=1 Tax=Kribbella voronezhensis TaxID=2512212 RepID=UPI0010642A8B|nr:hypothetical protein [Kribbella voronezhensis]
MREDSTPFRSTAALHPAKQRRSSPLSQARQVATSLADVGRSTSIVARSNNSAGLKNSGANRPIWLCRCLDRGWDQLWPRLTWLG